MAQHRTIVVALDGTPASETVIPYAADLARQGHLDLLLVHVIDPQIVDAVSSEGHTVYVDEALDWHLVHARQYLRVQAERVAQDGLAVHTDVEVGAPAEAIVQAARHGDAACIAMATHGRVGFARWALGSVADQVLTLADRPVLLLRACKAQGSPAPLSSIILPLDGSDLAEKALPEAEHYARTMGGKVIVLRAVRPVPYLPVEQGVVGATVELDAARRYTDFVTGWLGQRVPAAEGYAELGSPVDEVVALAQGTPGSMVVMSTHGRSGIGRAVLGSVTNQIVRQCGRPVLVVPPGAWKDQVAEKPRVTTAA